MKKYKVLFSVLILLITMWTAVFPAQAADHPEEPYYITAYHVDIDVSEDNVLSITEEIDVYFNEGRHGIYRTIPTQNEIVPRRSHGQRFAISIAARIMTSARKATISSCRSGIQMLPLPATSIIQSPMTMCLGRM